MNLYRFLYGIYFLQFRNKTIDRLFTRVIIRLSNVILPFCFRLSSGNKFNSIDNKKKQDENLLIVSLTTFPARIGKVWMTIESILRQETKPDKIILWLFEGEFDGKRSLPEELLALENRGLEIRFCTDNLMPHKKYYYTLSEFSNARIVTIDDDMLYPPNLLTLLLKHHNNFPTAICCAISRKIKVRNGLLMPYKEWKYLHKNSLPGYSNLIMGGGGTLFPAGSLPDQVLDKEGIIKHSLRTDDLWLKIMSLKANTKVLSLAGEFPRFFIPILSKKNFRLADSNIGDGQNDKIFAHLVSEFDINIEKLNEN
ncbi:glycosyltransferase [Desertivirga brevis]|uniref:glycosyltransferase n=1 Tax=Desertivirga brevis TaxID=2810310 RepID=UPI001A95E706|nr:glycosyltransferase [Pedobacter sp. SYSU D00873]